MYTNPGCKRLVDYYFVVSCSDNGKEQTKKRLEQESLAPPHEKQPRHALFALKPKIVDRYPVKNYADTPLLPWIARASMPRGVRARTKPPAPRYYTFTAWNTDGSKLYGACLEVYEHIDIKNQRQSVYIPKTLGFLSHYPYFYAFDVFLRCLWHVIPKKLIRLEDLLMHYFYDIPAPVPSKKIAYDLGKMKVLLACRNEFDVPIIELPIETPFTQLSKDRICMIVKLLLLEHRVVFVCSHVHELTPVCELFANLLFPLRWNHLFLPILSRPMAESLKRDNYEWPFLVGLPRFVYLRPEIQNEMPSNTYLVFLDRNEICDENKHAIPPSSIPSLPAPLEEALRDSIHSLARILVMPDGDVSRNVTLQAFRSMFAVITKLIFIAHNVDKIPGFVKFKSDQFIQVFKRTTLFSCFKKYYEITNAADSQMKSIYPFFKTREGCGKHFARRSYNPSSWTAGFERSQYSRKDAFRLISQTVIERTERRCAKKRTDMITSKRRGKNGEKLDLIPAFQLRPPVRDFLKQHFFDQSATKKQRHRRRRSKVKKYSSKKIVSDNSLKPIRELSSVSPPNINDKNTIKSVANDMFPLNINENVETNVNNNKYVPNANQMKSFHYLFDKFLIAVKENSTSDVKKRMIENIENTIKFESDISQMINNSNLSVHKNDKLDYWMRMIEKELMSDTKAHAILSETVNEIKLQLSSKSSIQLSFPMIDLFHKHKLITTQQSSTTLDRAIYDLPVIFSVFRTIESTLSLATDTINFDTFYSSARSIGGSSAGGSILDSRLMMNGNSSSTHASQLSVSGDVIESDGSESESESETDSDDSGGSTSSDWSGDDLDDSDDDEMNYDLRRKSAASVRQTQRFINLNEFEFQPEEKHWLLQCQKQHNSMIGYKQNTTQMEIEVIVAVDLFDDSIVHAWNKQLVRGKSKRYHKSGRRK